MGSCESVCEREDVNRTREAGNWDEIPVAARLAWNKCVLIIQKLRLYAVKRLAASPG